MLGRQSVIRASQVNFESYLFDELELATDSDDFLIHEETDELVESESGNAVRITDLDVVIEIKSVDEFEFTKVKFVESYSGDTSEVVERMDVVQEAARRAVEDMEFED